MELLHNTAMLRHSPRYHCADKLRCDDGLACGEESLFGGCDEHFAPSTCAFQPASFSDTSSLDFENESSFWPAPARSECHEDGYCEQPGSPIGMLHCDDESLDGDDEDATREWAPGKPAVSFKRHAYYHTEADETLSNELGKEEELDQSTPSPIVPEHRGILIQWMRDVCAYRGLSPATFFLAVSLLDRFLRATGEGANPPKLLQLVALTCVAVAAKAEQQQCAGELLSLARDENGNLYKSEDLRMMEIHLLDMLDWRLRMPTLYTFTSLLLHRVINRPQDGLVVPTGMEAVFRDIVQRLAELAVTDYELTGVNYSLLAVACVLVAETEIKGGHMHASLKTVESVQTISGLRGLADLSGPVQRLYCLYKSMGASAK